LLGEVGEGWTPVKGWIYCVE